MSFPDLPKGYRWKVKFSTSFGNPKFVVKIKKGLVFRRTVTEASGFTSCYGSPKAALDKAVKDAYRDFEDCVIRIAQFRADAHAKAKELNG